MISGGVEANEFALNRLILESEILSLKSRNLSLNLVSAIFYQIFIFHKMIAPQKL